jgi:MinD-like ATPase involved in chromosome partitioning or flagellar assembly
VLLVAKPDSEAVLEAYTVVKLAPHAEVAGKLRLVLNQSENLTRAQRVARQFADTCRKFLEYEINLAEPVGIALPTTPSRNSAYEQPLRLLAADILSDSTVYAARHKTYQASAVQALS